MLTTDVKVSDRNMQANKSPTEGGKRGRKPGALYFPRHPLKEVLPIAEGIWTQNAGNPFDILDVAKAVGQSPTSGRFVQRLASSYRYGLTEGSPSTKVISLTPRGSSIVAPTAGTDVNAQLRKALVHSSIFQTVYTWMDRKPIPREEVFRNTLMKPPDLGGFGIPKEDVEEFVRVFMQNIADYGLADESAQGVRYLRLDKLAPATVTFEEPPVKIEETSIQISEGAESYQTRIGPQASQAPPPQVPKQIFVAHGKNKKPLEQCVKILEKYKIPHIVASDEPHKGRPIGVKVAEEMKKCTAGIFIFTADEETKDENGKTVMRPSDNVVYELGAGSVLYGNKVVIFREDGVDFASDFTEFGRITFEKDRLDAKGLELMTELAGLDIIKFTVT